MEIDPVCQMPVDPDSAEFKYEYKGQEYCFCSAGCYDKFKRDPKDYL
jgi:Cu+-exporting ATPase